MKRQNFAASRRATPKPCLGYVRNLDWNGRLVLLPEGWHGHLTDGNGWRLALTAMGLPDGSVQLTGCVDRQGEELPPWLEAGVRPSLAERFAPVLAGVLARTEAEWAGQLGITPGEYCIELVATVDPAGRMVLRGVG